MKAFKLPGIEPVVEITLDKAREWLRIDGEDNDEIIEGLLQACPHYIEVTTGYPWGLQPYEQLSETVTRLLMLLWYNAEQSEAERLQRAIDNLLKVITIRAREIPDWVLQKYNG